MERGVVCLVFARVPQPPRLCGRLRLAASCLCGLHAVPPPADDQDDGPHPGQPRSNDEAPPAAEPQDEDIRLMLAVSQGDTEAFSKLYERHMPAVLRTLEMMLGERAAAEDLAQEAFLRIYNARDRYQPTAKFTTWLYRIATNLARNWQRDRVTRRTQPASFAAGDSGDEHGAAAHALPEPVDPRAEQAQRRLADAEIAEVVATAIQKLPDTQREALILSRYRQMSYQEIGEALQITPDAVKSLLARARANLKSALQPFWRRLQRELFAEPDEATPEAEKRNET